MSASGDRQLAAASRSRSADTHAATHEHTADATTCTSSSVMPTSRPAAAAAADSGVLAPAAAAASGPQAPAKRDERYSAMRLSRHGASCAPQLSASCDSALAPWQHRRRNTGTREADQREGGEGRKIRKRGRQTSPSQKR
eukprot:126349-Chlamydomonas_euryale.AAC.1